MFLGRQQPSLKSAASLLAIAVGAVGYMRADSAFQLDGFSSYTWVLIYLLLIVYSMIYGKQLSSKVQFTTPVWGLTLYTNVLSSPVMAAFAFFGGEGDQLASFTWTSSAVLALAISSLIGIGIGWSGWNCTRMLTATSYTIVGVACKFLSILINVAIWDKHASPLGIFWLMVCLIAGVFYSPSPLRESSSPADDKDTNAKPVGAGYKEVDAEEGRS